MNTLNITFKRAGTLATTVAALASAFVLATPAHAGLLGGAGNLGGSLAGGLSGMTPMNPGRGAMVGGNAVGNGQGDLAVQRGGRLTTPLTKARDASAATATQTIGAAQSAGNSAGDAAAGGTAMGGAAASGTSAAGTSAAGTATGGAAAAAPTAPAAPATPATPPARRAELGAQASGDASAQASRDGVSGAAAVSAEGGARR